MGVDVISRSSSWVAVNERYLHWFGQFGAIFTPVDQCVKYLLH